LISERNRFYQERDRRTTEYGVRADRLELPVRIAVSDETALSVPGQLCTLAMVNMAARVHRRLQLEIPRAPLLSQSLFEAADLQTACIDTARAIDPFIGLDVQAAWKSEDVPSVGVGAATRTACRLYVGAAGWASSLHPEPQYFGDHPGSVMGAGLAAVLGAASLMQGVFDRRPSARRASLWRFQEGNGADPGPREPLGPLDLGEVLVVGAGAVASSFFYWSREVGLAGDWEVVDGDRVVLHNTNRALTFMAADAGWPDGSANGVGQMKVKVVAPGLAVRQFTGWYENWRITRRDRRPDLVLPLANDFDARHAIGQLGENILIHATRSPSWTAQLHRHIAGRDDCIECRLPSGAEVRFDCSEGPLPPTSDVTGGGSSDAALPFLSAGAGLLLLAGLMQLQVGVFTELVHNHRRLILELGPRHTLQGGIHGCREGCTQVLSADIRRDLNAGTRWSHLG
jgi:hypothetical protein